MVLQISGIYHCHHEKENGNWMGLQVEWLQKKSKTASLVDKCHQVSIVKRGSSLTNSRSFKISIFTIRTNRDSNLSKKTLRGSIFKRRPGEFFLTEGLETKAD